MDAGSACQVVLAIRRTVLCAPLLALLLMTVVTYAEAAEPAPTAQLNDATEVSLDVMVDGKSHGTWTLLQRKGSLLATAELFDQLGLRRRDNAEPVREHERDWYALASVPQLEITRYFDERRLDLRGGARAGAAPGVPNTVAMSSPLLIPLDVSVNGSHEGNWVLLELDGILYAPEDALAEWRLATHADMPAVTHKGRRWLKLASFPGYGAQRDIANQSVALVFLPRAFTATRLAQSPLERATVTTATPALFANYDFNSTFSNTRGLPSSRDLGALVEVGASGEAGVLTSSHVGRHLAGSNSVFDERATWRRLETTFTRDFPGQNLTLRLGDAATRTGAWGRSSYFGGIQLTRNFALSPGFISQPVPVIAGQSTTPGTVELYINDALRQTSKIPSGPFAIDNFPLLTGSGQARVVVRDLLGRETVLVQDFFTHTDLLDEGLADWSLDAGALRRNLGLDNADYGLRFASGLWRYGINKKITLQARGEAGKSLRGAGAGLTMALPGQLLGQVGAAASDDRDAGRGAQWLAGLEHTGLTHNFGVRAEGSSRAYRQLAQDATSPGYRRQLAGNYTYAHQGFGSVGIGYARIDSFDRGPLSTYSANYSMGLSQRASVSFSYTRVSGQFSGDSLGISVLIPLNNQMSVSASMTTREGKTDAYVSAAKSLGMETGAGWRVLVGGQGGAPAAGGTGAAGASGNNARAEAGYYYQGNQGLVNADVSLASNQKTMRTGLQGGLVFIDRNIYLTRRVDSSFALVDVPGYANVGVGFQSSVLAHTDADGKALVPRLLPYRRNSIRLDPAELPINAEIDNIEQVVVPAARTGVKVSFPVRDGRGALVKIVLEDGEAAPAGTQLHIVGDDREFFVARRGEAFITGLKETNLVRLSLNGRNCEMQVKMPAGKLDDIARIGPVICRGVMR